MKWRDMESLEIYIEAALVGLAAFIVMIFVIVGAVNAGLWFRGLLL